MSEERNYLTREDLVLTCVEPSIFKEIIPSPIDEMTVLKFLEKVGRVCYKSEDKITDDSALKFIDNLEKRKHWAMLEHYVFVMRVSFDVYYSLINSVNSNPYDIDYNQKLRFINISKYKKGDMDEYLVSGSATSFKYLWECRSFEHLNGSNIAIPFICKFLHEKFPILMKDPWGETDYEFPNSFSCDLLTREQIESLPIGPRLIHDTMTVKVTTNIGIAIDMLRHRPASWAMESTRYVNYGKKGFQFIIPQWINEDDRKVLSDPAAINSILDFCWDFNKYSDRLKQYPVELNVDTQEWLLCNIEIMISYLRLHKLHGWIPQQAKDLLPKAYKCDLYMTANLYEWNHFFDMRADTAVHPDMKKIAYPILKQAINDIPSIYDDHKWKFEVGKEGFEYAGSLNS